MEQTIKNMESILLAFDNELAMGNGGKCKILVSTYGNLLRQLGSQQSTWINCAQYKTVLEKQNLPIRHDEANRQILENVEKKEYKNAEDFSIITEVLLQCDSELKLLIGRLDSFLGNLIPKHRPEQINIL